jgi:hypothetical protein
MTLMIWVQTDQCDGNGLLARLEAEVGQIFETWQLKSKKLKVRRSNDGWQCCVLKRGKWLDMNGVWIRGQPKIIQVI